MDPDPALTTPDPDDDDGGWTDLVKRGLVAEESPNSSELNTENPPKLGEAAAVRGWGADGGCGGRENPVKLNAVINSVLIFLE